MKLIIQIPCLNESATLGLTLAELPRRVPGFDVVEWLVVDDGSEDDTSTVARTLGVDHIVRHPVTRGLAAGFMTGLEHCLRLGADVIVNTDADNQYDASDIPALTAPIVENRADMVVGSRSISKTEHFSWLKKKLQTTGSWVVRIASKTDVADAPSGFRAISKEVALRLNVFNSYTYTLETIIQAGLSNYRVVSVPISTNMQTRPSRLMKSMWSYVRKSIVTIVRVFVIYRPFLFFLALAIALAIPGLLLGLRFVFFYLQGNGTGHIQSLILASLLLMLSALSVMCGILADLISVNRRLLERLLQLQRAACIPDSFASFRPSEESR